MLRNIGVTADNAGKKVKALKNIQFAGFAGAAAGAASLAAIGMTAGKTAIDFESQMSKVRAITNATSSDFKALEAKALELGGSTVWSSSEVAAGMEYLGMAGWKTQQILNGLPGILNLATAGGLDLARASDIASDVMTAMGMSADSAGHFADVFAKAVTSSNTNVEMLGETMKYTAPIAKQFGLSLEETTAISAKMADAGIKSSMAGTAMRAGLLRLATVPKPAAKALDKLGMSVTDSSGNMRNIIDILGELEGKLAKVSQSEKLSLAKGIFGVEAASGWLNVLSAGSSKVDSFAQSLVNSEGAAEKMALIMSDNVAGAFKAFGSIMERIQIQAMKPFLEPLKRSLLGITEFLKNNEKLASWLLIGGTVLSALLLVGGLVLGIASSAGLAAFSLGAMGITMGTVVGIAASVIGALAAVAGAVYLIYKNWDKIGPYFNEIWGNIKAGVSDLAGQIVPYFAPIGNAIKGIFNVFTGNGAAGITNLMKAGFNPKGIVDFVQVVTAARTKIQSTFSTIKTVISAVFDIIGGKKSAPIMKLTSVGFSVEDIFKIIDGVQKAKSIIVGVFKGIAAVVMTAMKAIGNLALPIFKHIASWWNKDGEMIKEAAGNVVKFVISAFKAMQPVLAVVWTVIKIIIHGAWLNIKAVITSGIKIITSIISIFAALFTGNWSKLWDNVKSLLKNALIFAWNLMQLIFLGRLLAPIRAGMGFIRGIIASAWAFIKGIFTKQPASLVALVRMNFMIMSRIFSTVMRVIRIVVAEGWNFIAGIFRVVLNLIRGNFSGAWQSMRGVLVTVLHAMQQIVHTVFNAIIGIIRSIMIRIGSTIKGKFNEVLAWLGGLKDKFLTIGGNIIEGLWNGIKNAAAGLGGKVTALIDEHVPGPVKKLLGIASPSKLFKKFGSWTMEGLSNGITAGAGGVMANISSVAKNMVKKPIKGPAVVYESIMPKLQSAQSAVGQFSYSIEGNLGKLREILNEFVKNLSNSSKQTPEGKKPESRVLSPKSRVSSGGGEESIKLELNLHQGAVTVHAANDEDVENQIQQALIAFAQKELPRLVKEAIRKEKGKSAKPVYGMN
ncbi:phage tail tape measure protein [Bacillus infantis]|nr:phage tail tape measure protein [Bacillus infantis]